MRRVAQTVLMVGNAVNIGTAHGNADGIRLDSLLKLADVKVRASLWPAFLHWAGALPPHSHCAWIPCHQVTKCLWSAFLPCFWCITIASFKIRPGRADGAGGCQRETPALPLPSCHRCRLSHGHTRWRPLTAAAHHLQKRCATSALQVSTLAIAARPCKCLSFPCSSSSNANDKRLLSPCAAGRSPLHLILESPKATASPMAAASQHMKRNTAPLLCR